MRGWRKINRKRLLVSRPLEELVVSDWLADTFPHQRFTPQRPWGPYFMDLYCEWLRLCVEVDGLYHNQPKRVHADIVRDHDMRRAYILVARVTNAQVHDGSFKDILYPIVVDRIMEAA